MSVKRTTRDQLAREIDTIYVHDGDRFVVSLIVGYAADEVDTQEAAAAGALELTRDLSSRGTFWHVHDRKTARTHRIEQRDFDPDSAEKCGAPSAATPEDLAERAGELLLRWAGLESVDDLERFLDALPESTVPAAVELIGDAVREA